MNWGVVMETSSNKMILAIMRGEDSAETIGELNRNGFYVTVLSTTGGFLKQKSSTILIGTESSKVEMVMDILKRKAGHRIKTVYHTPQTFTDPTVAAIMPATAPIPMEQEVGGVTVFVMDLHQMDKF